MKIDEGQKHLQDLISRVRSQLDEVELYVNKMQNEKLQPRKVEKLVDDMTGNVRAINSSYFSVYKDLL